MMKNVFAVSHKLTFCSTKIKRILSLLVLVAHISVSALLVSAESGEEKQQALNPEIEESGDVIIISQTLGSEYADKTVTLFMSKNDYAISESEIQTHSMGDVYFDEVKTNSNGEYSFLLKKVAGEYDITVNAEGVESLFNTQKIFYPYDTNSMEINIENFGNIFYDYKNVQVPLTLRTTKDYAGSELSAKVKLSKYRGSEVEGKGFADEQFYEKDFAVKVDNIGDCSAVLSIDLTEAAVQYGIFTLNCEIYSEDEMILSDNTRISIVNTPADGKLNSKIGTQNNFHHYTGTADSAHSGIGHIDQIVDLMTKSGFGVDRDTLHWHVFENKKGNYQLDSIQSKMFTTHNKKQLPMYVILGYDNDRYRAKSPTTPEGSWQPYTNVELDDHSDPDYLEAFGNYAYNAVLKAREISPETHEFEIFNEYNIRTYNVLNDDGTSTGETKKTTPESYVNLLKAAYPRIHEADPEAVVYGMATGHVISDPRSDYSTFEWLEEVLKAGGGEYMDAISVHIYTQTRKPEETPWLESKPSYNKATVLDKYRTIIDKYVPGMPIILSEVGYSSNEAIAGLSESTSTPEELQAKYSLRDLAQIHNKVDKVIWYNFTEKPTESSYEHHLGAVRMVDNWTSDDGEVSYDVEIPFEAKPLFLAISNFNALLTNAEVVQENHTLFSSVYDYVFKTDDGREIHMMWTTEENGETKKLSFPCNSVIKYDMYGNKSELISEDKTFDIELTDAPIYIEINKIYDVEFKNADNENIKEITDDITSVTVNIKVNDYDFVDAEYVVAGYDERDAMTWCDFVDIVNAMGNGVVDDVSKMHIIKVFGLEDFETLKPIAPFEKIERTKE